MGTYCEQMRKTSKVSILRQGPRARLASGEKMASSILDMLTEHPGQIASLELRSKAQIWNKNVAFSSLQIVITHMGVGGLTPGDV
jgi:hypothetical protein